MSGVVNVEREWDRCPCCDALVAFAGDGMVPLDCEERIEQPEPLPSELVHTIVSGESLAMYEPAYMESLLARALEADAAALEQLRKVLHEWQAEWTVRGHELRVDGEDLAQFDVEPLPEIDITAPETYADALGADGRSAAGPAGLAQIIAMRWLNELGERAKSAPDGPQRQYEDAQLFAHMTESENYQALVETLIPRLEALMNVQGPQTN
jgi:hypothetical protein